MIRAARARGKAAGDGNRSEEDGRWRNVRQHEEQRLLSAPDAPRSRNSRSFWEQLSATEVNGGAQDTTGIGVGRQGEPPETGAAETAAETA